MIIQNIYINELIIFPYLSKDVDENLLRTEIPNNINKKNNIPSEFEEKCNIDFKDHQTFQRKFEADIDVLPPTNKNSNRDSSQNMEIIDSSDVYSNLKESSTILTSNKEVVSSRDAHVNVTKDISSLNSTEELNKIPTSNAIIEDQERMGLLK